VADKVHVPEVLEPDERLPRDLVALRRFAWVMDQAFSIPGTRYRFGADALLGLIPGIGDVIAGLMSTWIIIGALRHRVPATVILRMIGNVTLDLLFGAVPLAGDVFDFLFEENVRNMRLLERYRDRRREPRSPARIGLIATAVVLFILLVAFAILAALIALAAWLIGRVV
jgi:hypothetical protein